MPIATTRCRALLTAAMAALCTTAHAGEVAVAVAANFSAPMQHIAAQFTHDTGHHAKLSFGATGKFYAQIHHGAPFGVLLAADEATPHKLAQEGKAIAASRFTYATGQLVLWSRQAGYVDGNGDVLKTHRYQRIAMANPKLAPYGAAAMQTLERLGLTPYVRPKTVLGENIAQTYQFAASGNAQLGFVALSQVMEAGKLREGSAWIVPAHLHAPIRQDAILLTHGQHNAAAHALLEYLQSDKARTIIQSYGYVF